MRNVLRLGPTQLQPADRAATAVDSLSSFVAGATGGKCVKPLKNRYFGYWLEACYGIRRARVSGGTSSHDHCRLDKSQSARHQD